MTIPILIKILFAFFLVDLFIIAVWAAIELVDEIRKRIRETPGDEEDGGRIMEVGGQRTEGTARGYARPTLVRTARGYARPTDGRPAARGYSRPTLVRTAREDSRPTLVRTARGDSRPTDGRPAARGDSRPTELEC